MVRALFLSLVLVGSSSGCTTPERTSGVRCVLRAVAPVTPPPPISSPELDLVEVLRQGGSVWLLEAGVCTEWDVRPAVADTTTGELSFEIPNRRWVIEYRVDTAKGEVSLEGPWFFQDEPSIAGSGCAGWTATIFGTSAVTYQRAAPAFGLFPNPDECQQVRPRFHARRCSSPTLARDLDYFVNGGVPPPAIEMNGEDEETDW